jgi:hypothetical protein
MTKQIILTVSAGDFDRGFLVLLRIKNGNTGAENQYHGKLPPAPLLPNVLKEWQLHFYQKLKNLSKNGARIKAGQSEQLSIIDRTLELEKIINDWLNGSDLEWQPIRDALLRSLQPQDEARLIIASNDQIIWQIPWYAWDLCKDRYLQLEIAIALPTYEHQTIQKYPRQTIRILAIIGDSQNIDVNLDRQILEKLSSQTKIDLQLLIEPDRQTFDRALWDSQGWDILFFAGHSQTDTDRGILHINARSSISIDSLEFGLKSAIEKGLHLAIFNSCDGIGIARALPKLNLPLAIVMRESVSDDIATLFLDNFLQAFSAGKSLYLALREAREKLQGLGDRIPSANWLPVLYHHPAIEPLTLQQLKQRLQPQVAVNSPPLNSNQPATKYLDRLTGKWQQLGCLDLKHQVIHDENRFELVARFSDFKISYELMALSIEMRGDAFFIANTFTTTSLTSLQQFSHQCLQYAKRQSKNSGLEQIYNARIPTNFCFSIAVVDRLDNDLKQQVKTTNPIDHRLDPVWYEIPIIYTLDEQRAYFFDSPAFWDNFKGEIVWRKLRESIVQYTSIPPHSTFAPML